VTGGGTAGPGISVSAGEIMSEQSARDGVADRIVVEAFRRSAESDARRFGHLDGNFCYYQATIG